LALLIKPLQIDFRNQDQREPVSKGEGAPDRGRLKIESEEMKILRDILGITKDIKFLIIKLYI
jgi:hypothetical protein